MAAEPMPGKGPLTIVGAGLAGALTATAIVGAGVGTSILPLRLGARPDMWLVTLGPVPR